MKVETVSVGGRRGIVANPERTDLEIVLRKYGCSSALRSDDRDGHKRYRIGRQHGGAVVRCAVAGIECIGFVETGHDPFDSRRSEYGKGFSSSGHPGLQTEFSELSDVIGVEVRDEDGVDTLKRHMPQEKVSRGVETRVDEKQVRAGGNECAGPGTIYIG